MAVVILCGLLSSTALDMLVVPALYLRFGSFREGRFQGRPSAVGDERRTT
jgi:Cu/Ag efflux pump CusA